jgi:hypothetical protein
MHGLYQRGSQCKFDGKKKMMGKERRSKKNEKWKKWRLIVFSNAAKVSAKFRLPHF